MGKRLKGERRDGRVRVARLCSLAFALLSFLALFPFHLFPVSPFSPRAAGVVPTVEGRLAVFDDVWETVRDHYYDPAMRGLDWEEERARFRQLAAAARDSAKLYAVLRRMLGELRDPHTRVFAPEESFDWQHPRFIGVGLTVRELESVPVVVAVERESEAEHAGLRAGDIVTSIDGEAALGVFARRLKEQAGAPGAVFARFQAMSKLFDGERGSSLKISWVEADGLERRATLKRMLIERDVALHVRRARDGVHVVSFDLFTQANAVDFIRAVGGELHGARALVIDLRQNGGGDAEAMAEIASVFLPAHKSLGRFTDRNGRMQMEPFTRSAMLFAPDSIKSFRGPVVILTSERTSSAAEIFVAELKAEHRATIIGQTTCGCVLAINRRHTLPDVGELDVSEMDYHTAEGLRLEGLGVTPDETVTPNLQDLRARRDRALERAIECVRGHCHCATAMSGQ